MPVALYIELRAAEETGHEFKLRFACMGQPMSQVVQFHQRGTGRVLLHKIVEGVHQPENTFCAAKISYGDFCKYVSPRKCWCHRAIVTVQ